MNHSRKHGKDFQGSIEILSLSPRHKLTEAIKYETTIWTRPGKTQFFLLELFNSSGLNLDQNSARKNRNRWRPNQVRRWTAGQGPRISTRWQDGQKLSPTTPAEISRRIWANKNFVDQKSTSSLPICDQESTL